MAWREQPNHPASNVTAACERFGPFVKRLARTVGSALAALRQVLRPHVVVVSPAPVCDWPGLRPSSIVLFVDFDGVMHRAENGSFEFARNLVALLGQFPQVDVVISSNWRINASREYLVGLLPESVRDRIRGVTPECEGPHARRTECLSFLDVHGHRSFLAIDDDRSLYPPGCPWVEFTDRYQGLDDDAASRVAARLAVIAN